MIERLEDLDLGREISNLLVGLAVEPNALDRYRLTARRVDRSIDRAELTLADALAEDLRA